ncbi:MAG: hypothetical protein HQ518_25395 [Rhodopirellula sp.]|nr:hypothetical protein [Rhodopirellula sp.]
MFNMPRFTVGTKRRIRWVISVLSFTGMFLGSVIDYAIVVLKWLVIDVIVKPAFAVRLRIFVNVACTLLIACVVVTWVWSVRAIAATALVIRIGVYSFVFCLCVTCLVLSPRAMCHVRNAYGLAVSAKARPSKCRPVSGFDIYRDLVSGGQTRESESVE